MSRVPRTIKYKVDTATEETILDLRLKRFGCNRIRFRLKRLGVYLSSRTIYKILKRHCLNILKCKIKNRKYRRFAMKHPNDMMVQMDVLGPFYIHHQSSARNYIIISCIVDDCSRKVASKCSERKSHLKCFYKHSIDRITEIITSRKVSPMWVFESVTYLCKCSWFIDFIPAISHCVLYHLRKP